jgi:hypothetical protein
MADGVMACDAETRAKQLELQIWKLIDAGKLHLENGTYMRELQSYPRREDDDRVCYACALGSAARAVCGLPALAIDRDGRPWLSDSAMRAELAERGVATLLETLHLEAGFESFRNDWVDARSCGQYSLDEDNPFFKLGVRLLNRRRPCSTSAP